MQKHAIKLLIVFQLVTVSKIFAQNFAINSTGNLPDTSAMLDISSSNKGFLMPRLTTTQMNAIPLPATGLIIFNTTINAFEVNVGTAASPSWQTLGTTVSNWLTTGNSGTNSGSKFIGTTDSVSLRFRTNNLQRLMLDSMGNVGIGTSPSFTSGASDKLLVDAGITNSYNIITAKGAVNNYLQFNVQNQSSGNSASSDLVATADNGSEVSNFVDMGVNGSGYTGGVMGAANDAYLFNVGNNLLVGTGSSSKSVVFMTGGTSQASNERMRIDGTGNVGIGTTSPGSKLDVKGTLRLSGSTSGYVGLTPAAAAGSTTYTLPSADGTSGQQLTTNGSGTLSWSNASAATTNTLGSSANTLTSTVNGVVATANAVNSVANTSSANTLSTTINGVAGTGVNIINTNALSSSVNTLTSTVNGVASSGASIINSNAMSLSGGSLTSTVNGVASSPVSLTALDSSIYKMDGTLWAARTVTMGANNLTLGSTTGNFIFNPSSTGKVGIGTTTPGSSLDVKGTLRLSGATSGYVGFTPAAAAGSTTYTLPSADGTSGQALVTNGTGTLSWAAPTVTTTHTLSTSANVITSVVNGITATANAVNTVANTSSGNSLSTTINGVAGTGVNIINTNALNSSTNTLTSTVNGVASTGVNIINTNALSSSVNTLTSTVNGVASSGASIINSNAMSLSGGSLTSTVNGVASSPVSLTALDSSIYKMDGTLWNARTVTMGANNLTFGSTTGNFIFNPSSTGKVGIGTTTPGSSLDVKGTLRLSGATSGYVGFAPAAAAGSTTYTLPSADGTSGQMLSTNGSGTLSWATPSVTTSHTMSSSANTITSIVNGITATASAVNSVSNTSSANTLSTTVNGITGSSVNLINSNALSSSTNTLTSTVNGIASSGVNIINSNALSLSGGSLTSTVNGVASSPVSLTALDSSIYKMDGTLWNARTVTMGANNLTFGSTTGNFIFNPSSTGKVGIGTTTPGSSLDVKGTIRLSGSTSGYVGFAPAAVAGSTTYTLPAADGTSGQQLTTNGSGTLSWTSSGSQNANNGLSLSGTTIQLGGNLVQASTITNNGYALNVAGSTVTSTFASNGYLGIGTSSPAKALHVIMNGSGTNVAQFQNTNAAGFSSLDFMDNSGNLSSTFGFANASTGGIFASRAYMNSYGNDFVLTRNSSEYNILIDGGTGNVGFGTSSPNSTVEVNGALATKLSKQSGTGTVTLDNTATVWYFTGAVTIALPTASTCTNRTYTIVNRTGSSRTISSFTNLAGSATTSITGNSSIQIISDGTSWLQIQ